MNPFRAALATLFILLLSVPAVARDAVPRSLVTPEGGPPEVVALWKAANAAERERRFLDAATAREQILAIEPEQVHVLWRTARDLMRTVEPLVKDEPERAIALLRKARGFAQRGRQLDPDCAECCFYDFAAVAREAATAGLMSSLGLVREMKPILDECLANPPSWRDSDWHSERASLYYGAAQFFRVTPDSAVVSWVIGFRGDAARAVEMARRADAAAPGRIDLRAELATSLLCQAGRDDAPELATEARRVVAGLDSLESHLPTDAADAKRARWLLDHPDEACSAGRNINLE